MAGAVAPGAYVEDDDTPSWSAGGLRRARPRTITATARGVLRLARRLRLRLPARLSALVTVQLAACQAANGVSMRRPSPPWSASLGTILAPPPGLRARLSDPPVHVIVPFTPGGAPDVLMRLLGQKLAEKWGQGVVVENRAGGNTLIGTVAGAKSAPDGYTLTARRRPDLRPQSAALQLAALFDEGVRSRSSSWRRSRTCSRSPTRCR